MAYKILVVEDDPVNIRLVQARLQQEGFGIILARDGDVALEKIDMEKPDLIVLDVEMPRMNGYMVVNELKNKGVKIPIIMLTGHAEMKGIFDLKGSVKSYLVKPINFDSLIKAIKEILATPSV